MRIVVGLSAGVGATGIAAGLGHIGTFIDVGQLPIDPSPLILMAPVIVVPAFAGAVLRGPAAIAAVAAGAVAAPIGAIFAIDGSCAASGFVAIGLVVLALLALVISGIAALAGDRMGRSDWFEGKRRRGVFLLVVGAATGALGWIAAVSMLGGCR